MGGGIDGILAGPERLDPGRPALVLEGGEVSYAALAQAARQAAANLSRRGLQAGSVVPLSGHASLLSVATVLGLARARCAAALVNPRLSASEIASLVGSLGGARVSVAGEESAEAVSEALRADPLGSADLLSGDGDVAGLERPEADDVGLVLFTSGTTGAPKAVSITQGAIRRRVSDFAAPFDPGATAAVSLMCVPLVHIGGMLGLMVSLAAGNTTVVQERFDAGGWLELVERNRVTRAFLVPAMLHRILGHPRFASADLSSLDAISYGAAPASPELVLRAVAALPHVAFTNVYGQTETLGAITALGPEDHRAAAGAGGGEPARARAASVGRPLRGVQLKVVDPATGQDVRVGSVGELWAKRGSAGSWVATGDLVRRDDGGYVYVSGRIGDTINRGGEKISPLEVESVLREHPDVVDAAAAAVPDAELGSRVGAAVVTAGALEPADLRSWCMARMAPFKVPDRVVTVSEIPYGDTGKVRRRELAELILARSPHPL